MANQEQIIKLEHQILDLLIGQRYPTIMCAMIGALATLVVVDPGKSDSAGSVKFLQKKLMEAVKRLKNDPDTVREINEHYKSFKLQ